MKNPVKKIVFLSFGIIVIVSALISAVIYYFLFTAKGSTLLIERFAKMANDDKPVVFHGDILPPQPAAALHTG